MRMQAVRLGIIMIELGRGQELWCLIRGRRVVTPNDPKLSDRRSWRGLCAVGVALLVGMEAQAVTAELVRCSALLGVAGLIGKERGA